VRPPFRLSDQALTPAMASSSAAVQAEAFPDGTTDYVPLRGKKADLRKPRKSPPLGKPRITRRRCVTLTINPLNKTDITDQPITLKNWYQHVNWLNTTFIIFIPLAGLVSSYWVPLQLKTAIFSVAYYFFAGLGISTSRLYIGRLRMTSMANILASCRIPPSMGSH